MNNINFKQQLFEKIQELSGIGSWHVDLVNQKVYWDSVTRKIHGVDDQFQTNIVTGINFYKEGESRDKITQLVNRMVETGEGFDTKLEIIKVDGSEIWVRSIGLPIYDQDQLVGFHGTFEDITKEVLEFNELEEIKKRYQLAIKAGKVGIWDWDIISNSLKWDNQMYELYGIDSSNFDGAYSTWEAGLHPDDKEKSALAVQKALNNEAPFDIVFRVLWPNGEIRIIKGTGEVYRDPLGKPIRMIGTNWDVTKEINQKIELEAKNEALIDLSEKLKQSNEQLEEFAYVASHDLKSPVRNMSMIAQFLIEDYSDVLDEEGVKMLSNIKDQSKRMTELIDDLLVYSTVNKMELSKHVVPMDSLIRETAELLGVLDDPKIEFKIEKLKEYEVDVVKMREVFNNLITNAIKYNKSEIKKIHIWQLDDLIYVKDNGIGLKQEDKEKAFSFFRRLHGKDEFGGGSGAGLAIVQKVLDRHNISINYESELDQGTTFILDFSHCSA